MKSVFKLIRVSNWVKNILIFFPLVFGRKMMDSVALMNCVFGFIAFSLLSSTIYVVNDIVDADADRNHPTKKFRPIASGAISVSTGYIIMMVCFLLSAAVIVCCLPHDAWWYLAVYFICNLLYSFKLKTVAILDVLLIAFFFELRLFLGGALSGVIISHWLCLLTFFLAAFITFSKRRDDVILSVEMQKDMRKSIQNYNVAFLDAIILLLASVLLIIYILYSISDTGATRYNPDYYISSLWVFLGLCRYLQLIYVLKKGGDPVKIFYSDRIIQLACAGWLATLAYFIYF